MSPSRKRSSLPDAPQELEHLLRRRYDASPQPAFAFDREGCRLYSNRAFDDLVGYDGATLAGTRPPYPYWGYDEPRLRETYKHVLSGWFEQMGVSSVSLVFRHRDGHRIPVVVSGEGVRDEHGEPLAWVAFVRRSEEAPPLRDRLMDPHRQLRPGGFDLGRLTPRECLVYEHLARGLSAVEIARELSISVHTARNHTRSIHRKLGVRSTRELLSQLGLRSGSA